MINQFDTENYSSVEPEALRVGDFWAWRRSDISLVYDPDLFSLKYIFSRLSDINDARTFLAKVVDGDFVFELTSAENKCFSFGDYSLVVVIERKSDGSEIEIERKRVNLKPNSGDDRSHAERVLHAINATIEKTATKEQASYSVAGRSLSRRSPEELLTLKSHYERIVSAERSAALRKQGKLKSNTVLFRLNA